MNLLLPNSNVNYTILFISGFFMAGILGTRPLVPLLSSELGASTAEIGLIVASFSFLPLLLAIQLGRWIDKIGSKKPLFLGTFVGSLALLLPTFFNSIAGIVSSQIIAGIAQTLFAVSAQSVVGNTKDALTREKNVAVFTIGVAMGSLFGPLVGGVLSDWVGYSLAFSFLGVVGLISSPLVFLLQKDEVEDRVSGKSSAQKRNIFELLNIPNLRKAFLISALVLIAKDLYIAYFPLLAKGYGLSSTTIGTLIAINAGSGIIIRSVMPKLIESFGRNNVILASVFCSGIAFALIPVTDSILILSLISFILGVGLGIGQPLSISTTIHSLPKDRVGEGLGLRISFNRLTQVTAPVFFGTMAGFIGIGGIFIMCGFLIVIGSTQTRINEDNLTPIKKTNSLK
jgi:predicted MFS family arabinose efflux permease